MPRHLVAALLLLAFFVAAGAVFLPLAGIQFDEVLFSSLLYQPIEPEFSLQTPWGAAPLMLLSYLGALKAWLWKPLLSVLHPTLWTLRLPALLIAALAAAVFYLALRRLTAAWAALLGLALLVTDTNYLLTSLYDWGPVALQHLLWSVLLYSAVRYVQEQDARWLAPALASLGLALWDKAICLWLILGFGAALLLFYPREVRALLRHRRAVLLSLAAFLLAALPFLYYNQQRWLRTFQSTAGWAREDYVKKILIFDRALGGAGLHGYLTRDQRAASLPALNSFQSVSVALDQQFGQPQRSLQRTLLLWLCLALPVLGFLPGGRRILFFAAGGLLSLFLMFSTAGAGAALHHHLLLWPLPQLLLALTAFAAARRFGARARAAAFLLCSAAIATNLAALNHAHARFFTYGTSIIWSDAIQPLVQRTGERQGREIYPVEWGITEPFRFLGEGRIGLYMNGDASIPTLETHAESRRFVERALRISQTLFIGHPRGEELTPGNRDRLDRFAASLGLQPRLLETFADRHGRPVFEVFEYRP